LPRFPARRFHDEEQDLPKAPRELLRPREIEDEIAVMLVDQAFQLLLHGLALSHGSKVLGQRNDDHRPDLFIVQRDWPAGFRHADLIDEVDDPTEHEQLAHVEKDENARADEDARYDEGPQRMLLGKVEH
jgi:hypothetical protein